jgi:dephospho-CoA kinase
MDKVWVVISSEQMARLIKRDNLSQDDAKRRMDAQLDTERRLRHADAFIDNSFGLGHTQEQVDELWASLKGDNLANG